MINFKMAIIPEIAIDIVNKTIAQCKADNSRTLFLVGNKSAGKSTLLYNFLDKTDTPRETIVLEYSFARKSFQKQGLDKIICHVWEYGGKIELLKNVLSNIPLQGKSCFIIMIDLSKIKNIWNTLQMCVENIKECSEKSNSFELIILGGKYDLFNNYDNEIKKIVCVTIRSVALINNAHVLFYSSKDLQLIRKTKEILNSACFGNGVIIKEKNTNFTKALVIPKGCDTWESIGVPVSKMEDVKMRYVTRIPLEIHAQQPLNADLQRVHPEPILDSLAAIKFEQLRNMETYDPNINDYLMCL